MEIIDISWSSGVDDNGIKDCLKLFDINAYYNPKITGLNKFFQTLEIINISGFCGVDDNGIKDCLKLININADNNPKIKKV